MWLDENLNLKRFGTIGEGKDEAGMLSDFADFVGARQPHLVTWNGRGFDLPVLLLRSLRHGLSWPWYYQGRDYRYRYSEQGHLDLCDFLSDHGAARMTSLDGAARLIGLPGKDGVDGSQVEGLFNAGQIEALRRYCLHDVAQTAFLFLRYRLLVGQLDRADLPAGRRGGAGRRRRRPAPDPSGRPRRPRAPAARPQRCPGPLVTTPASRPTRDLTGGRDRGRLQPLSRRFFARPTEVVAPELLGKLLVRSAAGVPVHTARIVEVEAYLGPRDLASHARRGPTPRAAIMFGPPGHLYVYLIYGMYHCMNFVCEPDGPPAPSSSVRRNRWSRAGIERRRAPWRARASSAAPSASRSPTRAWTSPPPPAACSSPTDWRPRAARSPVGPHRRRLRGSPGRTRPLRFFVPATRRLRASIARLALASRARLRPRLVFDRR